MKETNNPRQLNIDQTTSKAWELTKKHFLIFLCLITLSTLIGSMPNGSQYANYIKIAMEGGNTISEEMLMQSMGGSFLLSIICLIIQLYLSMVIYRLANDAAKGTQLNLSAHMKDGIHGFLFFLIVNIAFAIIVGIGTALCIIPGIFLGIRLGYAPLIAILHPECSFSDCFTQSWNITKGNFWSLFLLVLIAIVLTVLGFICCCLGLLVTNIIVCFIYIISYRTLAGEDEKEEDKTEDFTSENLTVVKE